MSDEYLSFKVVPTDASVPLKLAVWFNDQCCLEPTEIRQALNFNKGIEDEDSMEYTVRIELSGKTNEHTTLDEQGNIIKDALLEFSNFELMGINIDMLLFKEAKYRHNHNGNSEEVVQNFAMSMGCNGSVEFKFTTPIYMWLLENL